MRDSVDLEIAKPDTATAWGSDSAQEHAATTTTSEKLVLVYGIRLFRECLRRSLRATTSYSIEDYAAVDDWISAKTHQPSLVLLGLSANDGNTDYILTKLMAEAGNAPVVVTSDREDPNYVCHILSKGIRGYIPTSLPLDVTIGALQVVRAGGVFAPAGSLLETIKPGNVTAVVGPDASQFTTKQLAVISAIRKGKANKTIAYELNMCESTVKVHVRNIMKKMHARNRTEVAFIANSTFGDKIP